EIQSIVSKLKAKNIGVLITDHNVQETLSITDRAYLLTEGKIMLTGSPAEIAANEMARKFYLGQNFVLRRKKLSFKAVLQLRYGQTQFDLYLDNAKENSSD